MFVKLFTQILDSSIADNRRLRHFFTDLLLCADMRGYIVMTESAIARRIGATEEEVLWGLAELEKPDPRSKTPDFDGRRIEKLDGTGYGWRIVNFDSYRALKSAEEMREKTKERVRRYREGKHVTPCNVTVTHGNACNTIQRQKQTQSQSQKKEEKNGASASLSELKAYAVELGMPESDGEHMFDHWEANGWRNGQAKVKDWKAGFRKWKSGGWLPSQKQTGTGNKRAQNFAGIQEDIPLV